MHATPGVARHHHLLRTPAAAAAANRRHGSPSPSGGLLSSPAIPATGARRRASPRCSACGGTALRENALGFLICTECGAQAADHMAITQEVEEEVYGNMQRVLRTATRIKRVAAKTLQLTPHETELVHSQLLLHGFNSLLQQQARVLVTCFGAPAVLVGVVGRLWVSYIAHWRDSTEGSEDGAPRWGETHREMLVRRHIPGANYLHRNFAHTACESATVSGMPLKRARSADDPEDDNLEDRKRPRTGAASGDQLVPEDHPAATAAFSSSSSSSSRDALHLQTGELSMSLSLVLLYLACHLVRESVTLQQLCTWVHLGRLPFFSVRDSLPAPLWGRIHQDQRLVTFFHPQSCPSAPRLLTLAQRTAELIAQQMEHVAHVQMQSSGEAAQQAQLTFQQAHQLRRFVSLASSHGEVAVAAAAAVDDALPAAFSSTFNSSLLLRTWLEQLRLPTQLHPLTMEILAQFESLGALTLVAKPPRARKTAPAGPASTPPVQASADRQVLLMACLVLSVQLTLGTRAPLPTDGATSSLESARRDSRTDSASAAEAAAAAAVSTLPQYLALVLQQPPTTGRVCSPPVSSPSAAGSVGASAFSSSSSASIASNWSVTARGWPKTVHAARTLPARDQLPFVDWMATVCLARLAPPKDFDFYREQFERIARPPTSHSAAAAREAGRNEDENENGDDSEAAESAQWGPRDGGLPAASSVESPLASASTHAGASRLVRSLLACESVVSYASNRRGHFHALYSSLLERCSALIGIAPAHLHATTQRAIRLVKDRHAAASVYVNTQARRGHTPFVGEA